MRVAFYMHDLAGGGVERMRLALIAELRARGVDVVLILGMRRGTLVPLLPPDLPIVELGTRRTLAAIPKLLDFINRVQPDLLVSSLDHNNIAAMLANAVSETPTRLVICQHNALSAERGLGWKYRLVPLAYCLLTRYVNGIIAVSSGVAGDLATSARISPGRITTIFNPVIDRGFADRAEGAAPHPWLALGRRFSRECPVFVFVGRLTAQKDPATLLAAMRAVLHVRLARLILLGEGEQEVALHHFARRHGIAHAVAFVGFQANPLPWIAHADALVSVSRYEGLGNAIIEALACGTPVIATDCLHGPAEILLGGTLGRLVPVGDVGALAEAMLAQVTAPPDADDILAMRLRAAAFTSAACADAHLSLFERVLAARMRPIRALGMDLSPLRTDQVVDLVMQPPPNGMVQLVVTPNLDHVRLLRSADFAAAYAGARVACPDGFPVLLYGRLRGLKLRARVTGCDMLNGLFRHPELGKLDVFLVVESTATARAATDWSARRGLAGRIQVAVAPADLGTNEAADRALVREIRSARPSILIMTLGAPASEKFVHRHRHALPACWALCVGQALRVELGLARRAPKLWQGLGLEWLWRLAREPRRLAGRYAQALLWFPVAVWLDLVHREGGQRS